MWIRLTLITVVLLVPNMVLADETTKKPKSFMVEVRDVDGRPIQGANVGIMGAVGEDIPGQMTDWFYCSSAISDVNGSAHVVEENAGMLQRLCLIARHEGSGLSAIASINPATIPDVVKLTLVPECVVSANVVCRELATKWPPGVVVYVRFAGKTVLECVFKDTAIRLPLPPGDYEFEVYGQMTCHLKRRVRVAADGKQQKLEEFDLPASQLGLLQGRPAPEIPEIVGWKNGPAAKLSELRGKVILLDFFGYWCSACVARMPELQALHEKYHEQGLVVIGVHVDQGEEEDEAVDTAEKLDRRLAAVRATLWQGRDISFPVALVKSVRTRHRDDLPGCDDTARCAAAAAYGVMGYPSNILIDRRGTVVGPVHTDENGIKLLETTLFDE